MVKRFKCGEHIIYVRNNDFYTADVGIDGNLRIYLHADHVKRPNIHANSTKLEIIRWMMKAGYLYIKTKEGVKVNCDKYFDKVNEINKFINITLRDLVSAQQNINNNYQNINIEYDAISKAFDIPTYVFHFVNCEMAIPPIMEIGGHKTTLDVNTFHQMNPKLKLVTHKESIKWLLDNGHLTSFTDVNGVPYDIERIAN